MLDINLLRGNLEEVVQKLKLKGCTLDIHLFNELEFKRKHLQVRMEELKALRNSKSKQIGILKAKKQDAHNVLSEVAVLGDKLNLVLSEVAGLGDELNQIEFKFDKVQKSLNDLLYTLPNILDDSVPIGKNELYNKEIRKFGVPKNFDFSIKDHVELGYNLSRQMDFELGGKLSGSRFVVLKSQIAKLHRVLAQFMLDTHINEHGYTEVYVPYLVNSKAMFGTGQLPKFESDLFKTKREEESGVNNDNLYLIPTSEVTVTNLVADTILKMEELPLKFTAHTPCFRSEAGSYGRDTRGMIRMHQFDKVEMVQIVHPSKSFMALEELVTHAESILKKLVLPYRVMLLCSGDTSFGSAKTYDLEVWLPSQNTYREISSCSCMTDFQARRMQSRFKNIDGKNELIHTLNGSGLAVGRTLVAILENYQNADGSITVPEVLRDYMGCDILI